MPLPESEGESLPVGYVTKVGVRQEFIKRQGGKYGDCHDTWPTEIEFSQKFQERWPFYSQKVCEIYCIQRNIYKNCSCTDHYLG